MTESCCMMRVLHVYDLRSLCCNGIVFVFGCKKTNTSRKHARHALCNTSQSLGYTLNVKLRRQKKTTILLLKSLMYMICITQCQAPHVSMEAMQSTSRPTAHEAFPDTHLTACDLHCSGATAAWCAIHVTWSDRRPGYVVRFRNLMPSLRARHAGLWGIHYSIVVKTTTGRPLTVGR